MHSSTDQAVKALTNSAAGKTAVSIIKRLRAAGYEALIAGGAVRDAFLGRTSPDIDVATSAPPEAVQKLFPNHASVGAHFGVVLVMEGGFAFEVATFRSDEAYLDGRHPTAVQFSTAEQDALRRDFTINGMLLDPLELRLHDYVGGLADLEARVIRAIGDGHQRFSEDKLRLLRCVRFSSTLEFSVELSTWLALQSLADQIHVVSAERIRDELNKMFLHPKRVRALDQLDASGLLKVILPEVAALKGCEQPAQWHPEGDVFVHTRRMLELLPAVSSLTLVWAVLLHDIGKPRTATVDADGRIRFNGHDRVGAEMTEDILRRLRFSRGELERVREAVGMHMVFKDVQQMRPAKLRRFMGREGFEEELELHRVDCASSHGMLDNHTFLQAKKQEYATEPLLPPPLLRGGDLLSLGWKPGPALGRALLAVETAQLDGLIRSREEALEWLEQNRDRLLATD